MADETAPPSSETSKESLDLNALSGLNFGPNWADEKSSGASKFKDYQERGAKKGKGKRSGPPSSRDRRSGGRPNRDRDDQRPGRGHPTKRTPGRGAPKPDFSPSVKVDIYPQDEAFDALVKRLRASARTYQLFEIAHLLLEKPERYVVLVTPHTKKSQEAADAMLYYSVPGHLPFESEEQAVDFVLKEHIDVFFEVEEVELDPPKGNFVMVNRCGITNELLGPPNYHRYQEFLQSHYASRITGMSFERFQSRVVGSKEQEDIDAWLESMRKGARYKVKEHQEGEPEFLDSLEAARRFLLSHRKDKVVGSGESVRFAGRDIVRLPRGDIRRSVESYIEQQKHFPLDTANNIRGRLRRHNFAVYKKGNKGVSFVCAVKRKFRDGKTVFTDSIRDLIEFIEQHPDIPASKLSKAYIGIDTERQKPAALEMQEAPDSSPAATSEAATTPAEPEPQEKPEVDTEAAEPEHAEPPADAASPAAEAASPTAEHSSPAAEATPTEQPISEAAASPETKSEDEAPVAVEASTQATPKSTLSDAEQKKLNQLMLDLRWLITEGYVTEYGDGRLFAPAPLPEPSKKKPQPKAEQKVQKKDNKPAQSAPAEAVRVVESAQEAAKPTPAVDATEEPPKAPETEATAEPKQEAAAPAPAEDPVEDVVADKKKETPKEPD